MTRTRPASAAFAFLLLAASVAAVVAACAPAASSSGAPGSAGTGSTERTPGPSAAPALAAMLPTTIDGADWVVSSWTGENLEGTAISLDRRVLEALAVNAGGALADVEVAQALPRDPSKGGVLLAIRVPGADPKKMVDATFATSKALQLATIGGKSAYRVGASGLNAVVYPKDDVMFQVVGASNDVTEAILAALP